MPLSTLHARPYGRSYMTQGRCDWRGFHRTTLAFATPHRFIPALLPLLYKPLLHDVCEDIDQQTQDHQHEDEGDDGMHNREPPHGRRGDRDIGGRIAHGNRECVIHKIPIVHQVAIPRESQAFLEGARGTIVNLVIITDGVSLSQTNRVDWSLAM